MSCGESSASLPPETLGRAHWQTLQARAGDGDAQAQRELGYYLEQGVQDEDGRTLAEPSPQTALPWYTQAARQGDTRACLALGNLLSDGSLPPDIPAAIRWLQQAIDAGDATAAFNLGTVHRDLGDLPAAFRCYQQALALGDAEANLALALCCLFACGTTRDLARARAHLQTLLATPPACCTARGREDAAYWLALLDLLESEGSIAIERARQGLEQANHDDDHEAANALLNLIGKSRYRLAPPATGKPTP